VPGLIVVYPRPGRRSPGAHLRGGHLGAAQGTGPRRAPGVASGMWRSGRRHWPSSSRSDIVVCRARRCTTFTIPQPAQVVDRPYFRRRPDVSSTARRAFQGLAGGKRKVIIVSHTGRPLRLRDRPMGLVSDHQEALPGGTSSAFPRESPTSASWAGRGAGHGRPPGPASMDAAHSAIAANGPLNLGRGGVAS